LVATLSPHADPVSRVTVLDAGQALGLTEMLPDDDRRLYGESYLADTLAVRLGGRAAERLIVGEASTGAADDLASATALATQMIREYGLSDKIGPVSYPGPSAGHPRRAIGNMGRPGDGAAARCWPRPNRLSAAAAASRFWPLGRLPRRQDNPSGG
jgi:Peptidase family M41